MKTHLLIISLSIITCSAFAQSAKFQKVIKAHNTTTANGLQITKDGGFVVAAQTTTFSPSNTDMYLVKFDYKGDTVWTKTFGGSGLERANSVDTTHDGGYIVAGYTSVNGGDMLVVKTNSNGDTVWTRSYGSFGSDEALSVQQTSDGGYILAGNYQYYSGRTDHDVYLVKINSTGDTTWTRTYGGAGQDYAYSVRQTSDGGYILCGSSTSFGNGNTDAYVIKTTSTGDTLWTRTYGGTFPETAYAIRQNTDGTFIMAGATSSYGNLNGSDDMFLVLMEQPGGDLIWSKTYGGATEDLAYSMEVTNDNGYILAGYTNSFGTGGDFYVVKTNQFGDTVWTKTYGGSGLEQAYGVKQAVDGSYIIAGKGYSNYMYIVKTFSNGTSGCNESGTGTTFSTPTSAVMHTTTAVGHAGQASHTATLVDHAGKDSTLCTAVGIEEYAVNHNTLSVYPSPAGDQLRIDNGKLIMNKAVCSITNALGQTVLQSSIINYQLPINVSSLTPGLYFIRISNEKEVWTGRFVKE